MKTLRFRALVCFLLLKVGTVLLRAQTSSPPPQETLVQRSGATIGAPVPYDELRHGPRGPMDWMEIRSVSPDGRLFVTINRDNQQYVREVISGETLVELPKNVTRMIFSPDDKTIVCELTEDLFQAQPDHWQVYTTTEMRPVGAALKSVESKGAAWAVFFSPDAKLLADLSYVYNGLNLEIWDVATGRCFASRFVRHGLTSHETARFSPDGKVVAWLAFSDMVSLWDIPGMKPLRTIPTGNKCFISAAFSPNGKLLAVSGIKIGKGRSGLDNWIVRLYHVATGKLVTEQRIPLGLYIGSDVFLQTKFFPDGKTFVTASLYNVRVWSSADGKLLADLAGVGYPIAVSPDGKTFVARDEKNGLRVYDATNWNARITITPDPLSHGPAVPFVDNRQPFEPMLFSPDGATLIIVGSNRIAAYAMPSGELRSKHEAAQWEDYIE